jgi:hypothetical protein
VDKAGFEAIARHSLHPLVSPPKKCLRACSCCDFLLLVCSICSHLSDQVRSQNTKKQPPLRPQVGQDKPRIGQRWPQVPSRSGQDRENQATDRAILGTHNQSALRRLVSLTIFGPSWTIWCRFGGISGHLRAILRPSYGHLGPPITIEKTVRVGQLWLCACVFGS